MNQLVSLVLVCAALASGVSADGALSRDEVSKRVKEWQPKPEEKIFDQIGWADDIRQALKLGREHQRPVFVFTHDGRMNLGRC